MQFIFKQACSTLPILWSAFMIYNITAISLIYKVACIVNAFIAFFYHGIQIPCTHNDMSASYTVHNKNDKHIFLRTILRNIDLSLVCFLASFLALQNYNFKIEYVLVLCILSGFNQWSTTYVVCIMICISTIQYIHLHIYKGMLVSMAFGGIAFSSTPPDKWIQSLRYIWHASLALWIYGSGYIIH